MKVLLLIAAVVGAASATCRFPPRLWCSSEEIATQCKVYTQCKETVWTTHQQAAPVSLELYFESLCPDCQEFIINQLYPTWSKVADIMNLTLVPYGNAKEEKVGNAWKFTCQHGPIECVGNLLETCAINTIQTMDKIMPFIYCMEKSRLSPDRSVKACAQEQNIPLDPILSCYNSSLGNNLEHQMALRTEALNPPHKYVPWLVLNGVHTEKMNDEAVTNLLKLICDTYTGPKPSACPTDTFKPQCIKHQ